MEPRSNTIYGSSENTAIMDAVHANARESTFIGAPYEVFSGERDGLKVVGWGYPKAPEGKKVVGAFVVKSRDDFYKDRK